MSKKKILIAVLLIGLAAGAYVWFFVYNKSHTNYQKEEAAFTGQASALQQKTADAAKFETELLNKAVEITGTVSESGESSFVLDEKVHCTLQTDQASVPKSGENVTVKGRVVGHEEDILTMEMMVKLDQCVVKAE